MLSHTDKSTVNVSRELIALFPNADRSRDNFIGRPGTQETSVWTIKPTIFQDEKASRFSKWLMITPRG